MQQRVLGQGREVSANGFGAMSMSQSYEPGSDDTAEVYGLFVNEELRREALQPVRDQIVIATKFGFAFHSDSKQTGGYRQPARAHHVAEASLKRLRTDCMDLFYEHPVDPGVPVEDFAGAVRER